MESTHRPANKMLAFPKLTPSQIQTATALGRGYSISDAARLARIDRSTIYYWLDHRPEFVKAVDEARRKFHRDLQSEFAEEEQLAIDTLRRHLTDPASPEPLRAEASKAILSLTRLAPVDWEPAKLFRQGVKILEDQAA
jgi:hypothetical protein